MSKEISMQEAREIALRVFRDAERERREVAEREARCGIDYEWEDRFRSLFAAMVDVAQDFYYEAQGDKEVATSLAEHQDWEGAATYDRRCRMKLRFFKELRDTLWSYAEQRWK